MVAGDITKTAIITSFGLFEFLRMPFGLKNSAQTFQRLMDSILLDVPHAFVYLDDILVVSFSPTEHLEDLKFLFRDNGMVVNRAKCVLGADSVKFLGHTISAIPSRRWELCLYRRRSAPCAVSLAPSTSRRSNNIWG